MFRTLENTFDSLPPEFRPVPVLFPYGRAANMKSQKIPSLLLIIIN
jgi:hypothetical protein